VGLSTLLDVGQELREQLFRSLELEAKRPTEHEIVGQHLPQRTHWTPPIHGCAIV
jgi:hypothetical protein